VLLVNKVQFLSLANTLMHLLTPKPPITSIQFQKNVSFHIIYSSFWISSLCSRTLCSFPLFDSYIFLCDLPLTWQAASLSDCW
jgi:hypothetical protein